MGEHLRKRRIELGLYQYQAAEHLGVTVDTMQAWEGDNSEPENRCWPQIIAFLGYDPYPEPQTLGERLRAKYRELGLPRKEAARRLGMDENTLWHYEWGTWKPTTPRSRRIIERFLSGS